MSSLENFDLNEFISFFNLQMNKVINRTVSGHGSELKIDFYYILTTAEGANDVTDRTDFKIIFQPFIVLDIFGTYFNYLLFST